MNKSIKKWMVGTTLALSGAVANAIPINGEFSFDIDTVVPTPPGAGLDAVTSLGLGNIEDIDSSTGAYAGLDGTGGSIEDLDPYDGGSADPFATFGTMPVFTFAATNWTVLFSLPNVSAVTITGIVSDGPGFDPTDATMDLTFNRAGSSYSGSGSFSSFGEPDDPNPVPLPGTLLLTGLGLVAFAARSRKKS